MKKHFILIFFISIILIFSSCVESGTDTITDTVYTIAVPGFSDTSVRSLHITGIDAEEFKLPDNFTSFTDRTENTVEENLASIKMAGGILRTAPLVPVLETVSVDTSQATLQDSFPSEFTSYGFKIKLEDWTAKANGIYFYYMIYEKNGSTWADEPSGVIHYFFDTKDNKFWYREFLSYNFMGMGSGIIEISMDGVSVDPEVGDYAVGIRKNGVFEKNASVEMISMVDYMNTFPETEINGCQIYSKFWFTAAVNGNEYVSLFIPDDQLNISPLSTSSDWINDDFATASEAAAYYTSDGDISFDMMEQICQDVWGKQYGQENVVKINKNFMNHSLQVPSIFSEELEGEWGKIDSSMVSNAVIYNFDTKKGAIALIGGGQETQKNFAEAEDPYKVFVSSGFQEWCADLDEDDFTGTKEEMAEKMCREIYTDIYSACHFSEDDLNEAVELLLEKLT